MDNIIISRIGNSSPKYQQVWDLREEVLRKPLGMSLKNDDMSWEPMDDIFIAEHDGKVIGCLLLHHIDNDRLKLRQMAVYDDWQGKGIGRLLVNAAEKFAAEKGYDKMVLHARKVAAGFYKSMNYTTAGDEFTEVGIPHFVMEKSMVRS
jgi:N-acetylglutamate synthase-like GNAT family acetyltransferase